MKVKVKHSQVYNKLKITTNSPRSPEMPQFQLMIMEANQIQIQTSHAFKGTLGREDINEYIPHAAGAFVQRTTSKIAFNASHLFPSMHKLSTNFLYITQPLWPLGGTKIIIKNQVYILCLKLENFISFVSHIEGPILYFRCIISVCTWSLFKNLWWVISTCFWSPILYKIQFVFPQIWVLSLSQKYQKYSTEIHLYHLSSTGWFEACSDLLCTEI